MLSREEIDKIAKAIQEDTAQMLTTTIGSSCAVTDDEEYEFKWRNGEARIWIEHGPNGSFHQPHPVEYVFAVKIELVEVESK